MHMCAIILCAHILQHHQFLEHSRGVSNEKRHYTTRLTHTLYSSVEKRGGVYNDVHLSAQKHNILSLFQSDSLSLRGELVQMKKKKKKKGIRFLSADLNLSITSFPSLLIAISSRLEVCISKHTQITPT